MIPATYYKSHNVGFYCSIQSIFHLHCDSSLIQELVIYCFIFQIKAIFWLTRGQITYCLYESFKRLPKMCQIFVNILHILWLWICQVYFLMWSLASCIYRLCYQIFFWCNIQIINSIMAMSNLLYIYWLSFYFQLIYIFIVEFLFCPFYSYSAKFSIFCFISLCMPITVISM